MAQRKSIKLRRRYLRPLVSASLILGSLFQLAVPVFADGTDAGVQIINQSEATYEDPNNPGVTIDATSNTVIVEVAEVAGLLVQPDGVNDVNLGSIATGDTLQFDFVITNIGNEDTNIAIPGLDNIAITGLDPDPAAPTPITVTADLDGNGDFETTIPAAGFTTTTPIAADGSIKVRVEGTVIVDEAGAPINVQLGDTGPNDNSPATDNQPDADDGSNPNEVTTVDADPTEAPVNGEREGSAFQEVLLSTEIKELATITVLKRIIGPNNIDLVDNGDDPNSASDDKITYRLDFRVESSNPAINFQAADLEGTTITVDGAPVQRVLVSDVIPEGTVFDTDPAKAPTAPAGWTVVYSDDDPAVTGRDALSVDWSATPPADVKRIGFIADGPITAGTSTEADANGFSFGVITSGLPVAGGEVANIAQAFGETVGDPTDEVVYDESGDQNPNNYNDDGTPPDETGTDFNPATDLGIANPSADGVDEDNDNTGEGPKGEDTVVTITADIETTSQILNGPENRPNAIGPTNDNDDFTNQSTTIPAGTAQGIDIDPGAVTFDNTVENPNATNLDNVTLLPIAPSVGNAATNDPQVNPQFTTPVDFGPDNQIPDNTTVTIRYEPETGPILEATYTYTEAGGFTLTGGTTVNVGTLTPGQQLDYEVIVDLPETAQVQGYGIPIVAFVDNTTDGNFDVTEDTVFNITVDRPYTGYMQMVQEARILDTDGVTVIQDFSGGDPTGDQEGTLAERAKPGQFIEYRITYTNISEPLVGAGNVVLDAENFTITEDGTAAPNNWVTVTTHEQGTDPSQGTVEYFNNTLSFGNTDPASGEEVTRYVNEVGTVAPGDNGSFVFRRKVD
ncbi:MAG: hypothetical protein F6K50_28530 [Moorea sp. SIO3I7]|uniref:DUF7925 domain-containing protein n=1 Tax=Moorena bouillonii PNG TaxID=568701 RepID=A0A1U7N7M4_9CYAN|nr:MULTISPECIES: hypothetical protein [Moorena]NEN99288.1 hypothetical protein [Moorena sp. SIO3I7]NEO59390.1 hypothetical protein [Moorena sp. SIO4G2]NEO15706.1 hypothetical protein [Moorena sp. SIO3E8]NEO24464.1 hypothetical protein [Moorena sp. SIO4A5]NEQ02139.1 hypothetical protein [Moorena sp. SIO3F7]